MAYFNPVTTLDESVTTTIRRDGKDVQVQARVRRCMGIVPGQGACRRCWVTFEQAKYCAMRGHKDEFIEMYGTSGFKRSAIRRDAAPSAQAPAPAPSAATPPPSPPQVVPVPEPDLESIRAMALVLGYRLSRIPAKPVSEVPDPAF